MSYEYDYDECESSEKIDRTFGDKLQEFEDNYDNVLGILRDKGILKDSLSLGDITE